MDAEIMLENAAKRAGFDVSKLSDERWEELVANVEEDIDTYLRESQKEFMQSYEIEFRRLNAKN